jgi:glycosyltransferase involved in cell wall biosynthesis
MSWNLVTVAFGDKKYKKGQKFLENQSKNWKVNHIGFDETDLQVGHTNLHEWFAWKPYFILEAMKQLEEGDKILCLDALDIVHPDIFKYVDEVMGDDACLLPLGNSRNGDYTKRDCFHFMECDDEDYYNSNQLEAGFTFWRVCDEAKDILKEWLMWCVDERVNGELTDYSGLPQIEGFKECRHDQSILTNMAIRDGLSVVGSEIRALIECNADYWYERYNNNSVQIYRPIDTYLVAIKEKVPYIKETLTDSIVLTVHNQGDILEQVLEGIEDNTEGNYEIIVVLDGCTDNSEAVLDDYLNNSTITSRVTILHADNVFETKANNIGLREAKGDYVIIVQDDMVIKEKGWNTRMRKPFQEFNDVFAVTARTAHNYTRGAGTHLGQEDKDNCWCDIVEPCDEANRSNTPRDVFAVRGTVNRGPLMIDRDDLVKMDYLDEAFSPQDMDDHDLMFRMRKKLNKVCGCYWIDFESDPSWGGTRKETGQPAPWLFKAQHKNSKIFFERNADVLDEFRIIENRELPE